MITLDKIHPFARKFGLRPDIVMIDSITKLCLSLSVCTNGLSYSGEETRPQAVYKATPNQSGIRDLKRNKQQLLHRIQSVWTFTNLQYLYTLVIFAHNIAIDLKLNLIIKDVCKKRVEMSSPSISTY